MGASNNTTSLNMGGTIGTRNFSDYTTRQISSSISRQNYRSKIVSDERLQKFRQAVFKLVSTWTREDKLLIVSEYGDSSLLGKNPSDETLNRVCTESLIIHLEPGDLEKLYNDVMVTTRNLKKDIAKINKKHKSNKFNISSFESAYSSVKGANNARKYKAARKKFDSGFKVPKNIESQYTKLRKELNDVLLTCFNVIEITGIAFEMGIEVLDDMKPKDLRKAIINKTCLYVDLIVGKGKGGIQLSGAFMDSAPYDKLLAYTSYSYVTGKPGMDPSEWIRLKNQAREAKRAIAERARMQRSRTKFNSKEFSALTGVKGKRLGQVSRQIGKSDAGILKDKSFNELLELAGKYGIDPSKIKSEGQLKALIYSAMGAENKRIQELEKLSQKEGKLSKNELKKIGINKKENNRFSNMRQVNDLLNIHRGLRKTENEDPIIDGNDIPVISLSKTGMVNAESILRAVPVYIVGMGGAGDQPKMVGDNRSPYNRKNFGKRTMSSGIERGTISLNTYTKDKYNVEDIEELNEKDRNILNFILKLPNSGGRNAGGARSIARSLDELEEQLKAAGVYQKSIDQYNAYGMNKPDQRAWRATYLAWLYAYIHGKKKLMSYIENRYNLPKFKVGGVRRGIKKGLKVAGNILLGITTLGIGNLINAADKGITKNREKRRTFQNPQSESDLPEKDKAALKELQKLDVSQLKVIATKYGYSINSLNAMEMGGNSEATRWAFMAVVALAKGFKILAKYCEFKGNLKNDVTYRLLKKSRGNVFRRIATGFRILKNQAVFGNKPSMAPGEQSESEEYEFDPRKNLGQRLPIPKVIYKGNGKVDESSILEVVPVYVVNMLKGDNRTAYTEGIGGNVSNVEAYQTQNGMTPTKGKNLIELTRDASVILSDMQSRGYIPTSKWLNTGDQTKPIPGKGKAHKKYTLSDADLKWATANNFKFASGAYSFIAGDSLTTSPNPELVTIKGDGSFSVNPLRESAANGYSKMSLDNTDKFATGGKGVLSKLLMSPYEKLQKELQFISAKNQLIAAAGTMGLNADDFGIASATTPKQLEQINKRLLKAYKKLQKEKEADPESSALSDEARSIGLKEFSKTPIMPVYVVNKSLGTNDGSIKGSVDLVKSSIEMNLSNLMSSLGGPWTVAAPMGAGAIVNPLMVGTGIADKIMDTAVDVMDTAKSVLGSTMFSTGGSITKAATGASIKRVSRGVPKLATGGKAIKAATGANVITGDAMGSNIFAGGAKPELVQSTGDMTVTPLNKTGTEQKYKVSRMTSNERRSALAMAVSSHVVKYNYTLPSEASEVSNVGEAIKVFNVKPGITDLIEVAGEQTTLAALLANIYGQLALIAGNTGAGNELLSAIAAKPVANVTNSGSSSGDSNPFAGGFPSSLDSILGGE